MSPCTRLVLLLSLVFVITARREGQPIYAQEELGGGDILFTAFEPSGDANAWLARYDTQSDTIVPFYVAEGDIHNQVYALRWSRDGQILAVYRFAGLSKAGEWLEPKGHICLLSRAGELLRCLEQPPLMRPAEGIWQLGLLNWSQDGRQLYFAAELEDAVQLLEIDVASRDAPRVLHSEPYYLSGGYPTAPSLSWTPDLRYIIVNAGNPSRTLYAAPQTLLDRQTGESLDLGARLRSQADRLGNLTQICLDVSPHGTYLSALGAETGETLGLVNMQGEVVRVINAQSGQGSLTQIGCPHWAADESGFFFIAASAQDENAYLFRYHLASEQLEVFYRLPDAALSLDVPSGQGHPRDLQIGPGTHAIVGVEPFTRQQPTGSALAIITYQGEYKRIPYPPYRVEHPIWVPPLSTPTPSPIYRAIQVGHQVHLERALSAGLDTFDSPPKDDGWTLIGRTHGSDTDGTLMAFVVLDNVPYAAVQNAREGCIVVTPERLEPVHHGGTRQVRIVEEGVAARCAGDWSAFAP